MRMRSVSLDGWTRRTFARGLAGAAVATRASAACLQSRSLRWIIPHPPGGGYDAYSRLVSPYLGRRLGVGVRLDHQAGGGGLRGIRVIHDARPDGATVGLINMPGALVAHLLGGFELDPLHDLTVLGTVSRQGYYWAAGADSRLRSTADVMAAGRAGDLVFGVNAASSTGFLSTAIAVSLLGWKVRFVSGYDGSPGKILAALRGEVDLVALSWDVLAPRVRSGELRALFAVDDKAPGEDYPELAGVGSLVGTKGLISEAAAEAAQGLLNLMRAGRVLAATPELDPAVEKCLSEAVCATLMSPELARESTVAGSALQPICAAETKELLRRAQADLHRLAPLAREAIEGVGL